MVVAEGRGGLRNSQMCSAPAVTSSHRPVGTTWNQLCGSHDDVLMADGDGLVNGMGDGRGQMKQLDGVGRGNECP